MTPGHYVMAMLVKVVVDLLREGTWVAAWLLMILITFPKIDCCKGSLSRTHCDGLYANAKNDIRPMTAHFYVDSISHSLTFNSFIPVQYHMVVANLSMHVSVMGRCDTSIAMGTSINEISLPCCFQDPVHELKGPGPPVHATTGATLKYAFAAKKMAAIM